MRLLRYWVLGMMLILSCSLMAVHSDKEEALTKARQFYAEHINHNLRSSVDFQLVYTDTSTDGVDSAGFYVFNAGDDQGYVMVSGSDAVRPILGYSDSGRFPKENIPENLKSLLDFYHREIQYASRKGLTYQRPTLRSATSSVAPLMTTKWDQPAPYNLFCPYHPGYMENALTGCAATAMAQVMNFHKWPVKGTGVHSYPLTFNSKDTVLTVKYGETTYPWNDMNTVYDGRTTPAQDSAVALLSYHCGVAANMNYNVNAEGGSGANIFNVGRGMIDYLGYDPDLQLFLRFFYKTDSWEQLLRKELDARRPIIYGGASPDGGHAFVCDGYDSKGFFHFNWGWGGTSNGYFTTTAMNPDDNDDANSISGYSFLQYGLLGIQKPDGVDKQINMMALYGSPLTISKSFLSAVSIDTFSIKYGFWNYGINEYRGTAGAGLYQNGNFLKCLAVSDIIHLEMNTGNPTLRLGNLSLAGLSDGDYQLYPVYQPQDSIGWSLLKPLGAISNLVEIHIQGNTASLNLKDFSPHLNLTDTIGTNPKYYQNRKSRFLLPLKNTGSEFYSYLNLHVYSETNPENFQDLDPVLALIKTDESQIVEMTTTINLSPGNYLAYAQYDSSSAQNMLVQKRMSEPFRIAVLPEPSSPLLTIDRKIKLPGGDTIYIDQPFTVTSDIRNIGGYYDGTIMCYVFPAVSGASLTYFGAQDLVLDSVQTKTATLTGSMTLAPGNYRIGLYYFLNNNWVKPYAPDPTDKTVYAILPFTLMELETGLPDNTTMDLRLASNPVGEVLELITDENVLSAAIHDLSGRLLSRSRQTKTLATGSIGKGMYLLQVSTEKGLRTIRFIKK